MPTQSRSVVIATISRIPSRLTDDWNWDRRLNTPQIIFSSRLKFPKALEKYGLLSFFGTNVLTAEFDDWKRHRKITAPAFTEVRRY